MPTLLVPWTIETSFAAPVGVWRQGGIDGNPGSSPATLCPPDRYPAVTNLERMRETPGDYLAVLADLKRRITTAQARAALSVNRELVALYWHVGATIVRRQQTA